MDWRDGAVVKSMGYSFRGLSSVPNIHMVAHHPL